jgi:hypothetical protein
MSNGWRQFQNDTSSIPQATVHVHQREFETFVGRPRQLSDLAYLRQHIAHRPRLKLYRDGTKSWYGFPAW